MEFLLTLAMPPGDPHPGVFLHDGPGGKRDLLANPSQPTSKTPAEPRRTNFYECSLGIHSLVAYLCPPPMDPPMDMTPASQPHAGATSGHFCRSKEPLLILR